MVNRSPSVVQRSATTPPPDRRQCRDAFAAPPSPAEEATFVNAPLTAPLPGGVRVLVAGGHEGRDRDVLDFSTELGRALMRTGHDRTALDSNTHDGTTRVVLVTGGHPGTHAADGPVVTGAREALDEIGAGTPLERIVTF